MIIINEVKKTVNDGYTHTKRCGSLLKKLSGRVRKTSTIGPCSQLFGGFLFHGYLNGALYQEFPPYFFTDDSQKTCKKWAPPCFALTRPRISLLLKKKSVILQNCRKPETNKDECTQMVEVHHMIR